MDSKIFEIVIKASDVSGYPEGLIPEDGWVDDSSLVGFITLRLSVFSDRELDIKLEISKIKVIGTLTYAIGDEGEPTTKQVDVEMDHSKFKFDSRNEKHIKFYENGNAISTELNIEMLDLSSNTVSLI